MTDTLDSGPPQVDSDPQYVEAYDPEGMLHPFGLPNV